MRLLRSSIYPALIYILQLVVATWFTFEFFLASDSLTADRIWRLNTNSTSQPTYANFLLREAIDKLCNYNDKKVSFDKLVLIVVDALGSEFIPTIRDESVRFTSQATSMPFIEEKIRSGQALGMVAKAATPTVTMPRVKALLSGTIPSFIDIAYNLAADVSNFQDDNFIKIAKASNKSIVFYGDDTWLALFKRNTFTRVEETFSFFASDYTTVDTNVTRRALAEVESAVDDWDIMALHYLGLDHIGHVFGTNSNDLIVKKLLEMDSVISAIYQKMAERKQSTLIVICGDHGMSPEGNHGGGSRLEADTALIFIPINLETYDILQPSEPVLQIDLAVTLSSIFHLPLPSKSKGVVISSVLKSIWTNDTGRVACACLKNMEQLMALIDLKGTTEEKELELLIKQDLVSSSKNSNRVMVELLRKIQTKLLETITTKQDYMLVIIFIILVTGLSLNQIFNTWVKLLPVPLSQKELVYCTILAIIPIVMQGSTDYIESEHMFWLLYSLISLILLPIVTLPISEIPEFIRTTNIFDLCSILSLPLLVIITKLMPMIDTTLIHSYIIPLASILYFSHSINQSLKLDRLGVQLVRVTALLIIILKNVEEYQFSDGALSSFYKVVAQRLGLISLLVIVTFSLCNRNCSNLSIYLSAWHLSSFFLARRSNLLYLCLNWNLEAKVDKIMKRIKPSILTITLVYSVFAQNAFYCQGNSNLFSSLDIRPAFYGQTEFSIIFSVLLIDIATFSSQVFWIIRLFQRTTEFEEAKSGHMKLLKPQDDVRSHIRDLLIIKNFIYFSYYSFVCLVLRNHLFIWSVISPKLVYLYVSNTSQLIYIYIIFFISKCDKHRLETIVLSRKSLNRRS